MAHAEPGWGLKLAEPLRGSTQPSWGGCARKGCSEPSHQEDTHTECSDSWEERSPSAGHQKHQEWKKLQGSQWLESAAQKKQECFLEGPFGRAKSEPAGATHRPARGPVFWDL